MLTVCSTMIAATSFPFSASSSLVRSFFDLSCIDPTDANIICCFHAKASGNWRVKGKLLHVGQSISPVYMLIENWCSNSDLGVDSRQPSCGRWPPCRPCSSVREEPRGSCSDVAYEFDGGIPEGNEVRVNCTPLEITFHPLRITESAAEGASFYSRQRGRWIRTGDRQVMRANPESWALDHQAGLLKVALGSAVD